MASVQTTVSGLLTTGSSSSNGSNETCKLEGLLLPILNESGWPVGVRAGLYMAGMIYCFLGISIVADVFMCAIEKITSRTRTINIPNPEAEGGYEKIEVKVWNDAVANLTLMALGTSSPEILLSVIETVGHGFMAGDLGPGTIVGSAAFNLLVITAVCVMAIPSPEVRRISTIKVFIVTALFSLFAYFWLIVVLVIITPDELDIWEAVLTFLFFPILVLLAYLADKDPCSKKTAAKDEPSKIEFGAAAADGDAEMPLKEIGTDGFDNSKHKWNSGDSRASIDGGTGNHITTEKMRQFVKELHKKHPELSEEEIARLAANKMAEQQPHNRLWYRINFARSMGGNPKLVPSLNPKLQQAYGELKVPGTNQKLSGSSLDLTDGGKKTIVEFEATQSSVLEKEGKISVGLRRYGKTDVATPVRLETIDGTAEAGSDYNPIKMTLIFEKGETHKSIDIGIIDDDICEPDEMFFVKLSLVTEDENCNITSLGHKAIHEVTIIDDDKPGIFEFHKPSMVVKESVGTAALTIVRSNGADGRITVKWKTADITAESGKDYDGGEGELVFEHGESTKDLDIKIFDDGEFEKDEHFKVELTAVDGGAEIGKTKMMVVTIVNDDDFKGMVGRLVNMTNVNVDNLRVDSMSWRDQFRNAMNVNGGDVESATNMDYLMHFLTFGWKVIFAIIPPPGIGGGWPSFIFALSMIGLLTAIVGDLATIFGCLVGLPDAITAITFVAVGTSVPDLFASKTAAVQEKTADNSIGNVTGSNSVNVFLGMGLPWMLASIYWASKGEKFIVKAGTLGFSVTVYLIVAVVCLGVLMMKRSIPKFGLGELGGPTLIKWGTAIFLICLWLLYIILSSLQVKGIIEGF